jgi:hypothetical protein
MTLIGQGPVTQSLSAAMAVLATAVAFVSLVILHVVSPEFNPSWRMVSAYAEGRHGWLLSIMFAAWGIGSLSLAVSLGPVTRGWMGRCGLLLLALVGIGEVMAAFFDKNHRLHGPAAMFAIPGLPIAAALLTITLRRSGELLAPPAWMMHLTWISFLLMVAGMMLFMRSLSKAGVEHSTLTRPAATLPATITPFVGWANRLLVVAYMLWVLFAALSILRHLSPS